MVPWKKSVCLMLIILALTVPCVLGVEERTTSNVSVSAAKDDVSEINPMADQLVVNCAITKKSEGWFQSAGYPSYKVWVNNTTNQQMKVTVTNPRNQTQAFYVPPGGNKSYVSNHVDSGFYKVSFSTSNNVLSGTVRVRTYTLYMNNKISEQTGGCQQRTIGGDYLRSTNSINQEFSNSNITLGVEKGQNMISVIRNVFGYDLSSYHYVSFAELWGNDPLPSETRAIKRILTDLCMEIEAGERAPLGFLYQGNDVYTVVEQPDGSLELAQYKVQLVPATQSINGAELEAFPDYQIVDTEIRTATQDIVQSLYE